MENSEIAKMVYEGECIGSFRVGRPRSKKVRHSMNGILKKMLAGYEA